MYNVSGIAKAYCPFTDTNFLWNDTEFTEWANSLDV